MPSYIDVFERAIRAGAISRQQFLPPTETGLPLVLARLGVWQRSLEGAMADGMREWAALVEREMQQNARWQNRTGHARAALRAYLMGDDPRKPEFATEDPPAVNAGKDLVVIVTGLMYYNIFLELKDSGRFAIMWPTVVQNNATFMKILVAHGQRVT
jgi:hypothetical protein